jgi:hypothetical protein
MQTNSKTRKVFLDKLNHITDALRRENSITTAELKLRTGIKVLTTGTVLALNAELQSQQLPYRIKVTSPKRFIPATWTLIDRPPCTR